MCATFAELNCDIVCIIVLFQFQYLVFSRIYFSACVWFASMFVPGELSWIWHVFRFIHNTIQYYGVPCAMWRSARTRSLWCFSRYYICADVTSKRSDGIYDANHTITNDTLSDEDIFVKKKTFFLCVWNHRIKVFIGILICRIHRLCADFSIVFISSAHFVLTERFIIRCRDFVIRIPFKHVLI